MENEHYKYYYAQLSDTVKSIYDAMYEMYTKGDLRIGKTSVDLV